MGQFSILQRHTSRGIIRIGISRSDAKRGLASGKYRKQIMRDASGRAKGSLLVEDYITPSTSRDTAAAITTADMRANVGEFDHAGRQIVAKRKITAWHELTMQFRQVVTL